MCCLCLITNSPRGQLPPASVIHCFASPDQATSANTCTEHMLHTHINIHSVHLKILPVLWSGPKYFIVFDTHIIHPIS